jgi:hypothetical protein
MAQQQPMVDTARVNFSGMSEEAFENLGEEHIGDVRIFTVRARVKGFSSVDMAEAGVRRSANLKVLKVVEGVSKKVLDDGEENQKSLFDAPSDDDQGDDSEPEATEKSDETNVARPAFGGGPQFSAGDE